MALKYAVLYLLGFVFFLFIYFDIVLFQVTLEKKWLSMYKEIFGDAAQKVQTAHGLKTFYIR